MKKIILSLGVIFLIAGGVWFFKKPLVIVDNPSSEGFVKEVTEWAPDTTLALMAWDYEAQGLTREKIKSVLGELIALASSTSESAKIFEQVKSEFKKSVNLDLEPQALEEIIPRQVVVDFFVDKNFSIVDSLKKQNVYMFWPKEFHLVAILSGIPSPDKLNEILTKFEDLVKEEHREKEKNKLVIETEMMDRLTVHKIMINAPYVWPAGLNLFWVYDSSNKRFVLADDEEDLKWMLQRRKSPDNITTNAAFSKTYSKLAHKGVALFYIDFSEGSKELAKNIKNEKQSKLLGAFTSYIMSASSESDGIVSDALLYVDADKAGPLWEQISRIETHNELKFLPFVDTKTSMVFSFDFVSIWRVIEVILKSDPQFESIMNLALMNLGGIDFEKDIIGNLTGEISQTYDYSELIASSMSNGNQKLNMSFGVGYKDEKKAREVFAKLGGETYFNEDSVLKYSDQKIYSVSLGIEQYSLSFIDGIFLGNVSSTSLDRIKGMIDTYNSDSSLKDSTHFKEWMKRYGAENPFMFAYSNASLIYSQMGKSFKDLANGDESTVLVGVLFDFLSKYLGESLGSFKIEKDGLRMKSMYFYPNLQ